MFLFTVAWRNLWRHRRRSLITAAAMGVGMALVLFVIALTDGMYSQMFDVMVTQNLGHVQVHHPDYPERRRMYDTVDVAGDAVAKMESTPGVTQLTTRVFGFALAGSEDKSAGARLVGVLPDREQGVTHADQRVVAGRFLGAAPAREAVIGDEMAEELAGKHFAGSWLSYRRYKEEYKEDPVEYQRNQYDTAGATQPLDSVPENGTVNSP